MDSQTSTQKQALLPEDARFIDWLRGWAKSKNLHFKQSKDGTTGAVITEFLDISDSKKKYPFSDKFMELTGSMQEEGYEVNVKEMLAILERNYVFDQQNDSSTKDEKIRLHNESALSRKMQFTCPEFESAYINDVDTKVYRRFKLCRGKGGIDGGLLLVKETSGEHAAHIPVPIGSDLEYELSSACRQATVKTRDGETKTLAEMLDAYKQETFERATELAKSSFDDAIKYLLARLPGHYLRDCVITLVYKKLKAKTDDGQIIDQIQVECLTCKTSLVKHFSDAISDYARHPSFGSGMPALFTNNPSVFALHYVDLDAIIADGECPTWDGFLRRYIRTENKPDGAGGTKQIVIDQREVMMAWFWSVFNMKNNGRQLLYIYDNGYTGKSVMIGAIARYLGDSLVAAIQKDSLNNQFSIAKVWDKRLVIRGDNKDRNLLRAEKMHLMLGEDTADVEVKGKNSFTARCRCKIIAAGNVPLQIDTAANHESSRLITVSPQCDDETLKQFCKVDENGELVRDKRGNPIQLGDASFGDKLYAEMPQFLRKCKEVYAELCPTDSAIIVPEEMTEVREKCASSEEQVISDAVFYRVEFDSTAITSRSDLELITKNVRDTHSYITFDDIITYFSKRAEISVSNETYGGERQSCYTGLRLVPWVDDKTELFEKIGAEMFDFSDKEGTVTKGELATKIAEMMSRESFTPVFEAAGFARGRSVWSQDTGKLFLLWLRVCKNCTEERTAYCRYVKGVKLKSFGDGTEEL